MPKFNSAYARKSTKYWPLWEVTLVANWNTSKSIQARGIERIIRLFHTKKAAEIFADGLNELVHGSIDVSDEIR